MNSSIILKSTDTNNKEQSKTITFINPEAASDKLVTFAQGLNRLTNNTYKETNRVDKLNCDTDQGKTYNYSFSIGDIETDESYTAEIVDDTGALLENQCRIQIQDGDGQDVMSLVVSCAVTVE